MSQRVLRATVSAWFLLAAANLAPASERIIPKPLPEHPGNVFLAGEEVAIDLPAGGDAWRAVDYDGKVVAEGHGGGRIVLGRLPVGYYEVRQGGEAAKRLPVTIARAGPAQGAHARELAGGIRRGDGLVLSRSRRCRPPRSLCALAGLNWVRDRLNWRDMENQRGMFAGEVPLRRLGRGAGRRRVEGLAGQSHVAPLELGGQAVSAGPPRRLPLLPRDGPPLAGQGSGLRAVERGRCSISAATPAAKWPPCRRRRISG